MSITIAEANILRTILGSGSRNLFIMPNTYCGVTNTRSHQAALNLEGIGLCVVEIHPNGLQFFARSVAKHIELQRLREAEAA